MSETATTRRGFLQAAAATAAILPWVDKVDGADKKIATPIGRDATELLKKYAMTDQYGANFDVEKTLSGKPYLVAFGWDGCPFCNNQISPSIAAIQKKLLAEKIDIPIVLVTIKPETDKKKLEDYVGRYKKVGVQQFANAEVTYEQGKDKPAKERTLHVLCAKSEKEALALHDTLGLLRIEALPNNHSSQLLLVTGRGKIVDAPEAGIAPAHKVDRARLADAVFDRVKKVLFDPEAKIEPYNPGPFR